MPNGRCKMHGGKAGRKAVHGITLGLLFSSAEETRELLKVIKELLAATRAS